ncbi:MAG: hypothetical protein HY301_03495 [Verrucomicrobia bacterium]|nr:hypothetical protein [Verrucomicrobiota bacterium]
MNTDDLEQKLRRQPLRELPSEWRAQILAACGAQSSRSAGTIPATPPGGAGAPRSEPPWWLAWFNPSRAGWAALGAVWLVIAALNFAGPRDDASVSAPGAVAASPHDWLERRRIMAELIGPAEPPEPPAVTRPRSERRANIILLCV